MMLVHSPFTVEAKHVMLGNGVPLPMGRALAKAVKRAIGMTDSVTEIR